MYTKGEWKIEDCKPALATYIGTDEHKNIAMVSWTVANGIDEDERKDNAQLIVLAPEMLTMLKRFQHWHKGDKWRFGSVEEVEVWQKLDNELHQLINKAEGV